MRQALILSTILFLTGCGFSPVYGTMGRDSSYATEDYLEQVEIANIPNQEGQFLRNALIDRFYRYERPVSPAYILSLADIKESRRDLDVTKTDDTTRAQLRLDTRMILRETDSGKKVLERKLIAITSYNVLAGEFATRVAEDNARENALTDLARQIELQLGLFFKR